MIKNVIYTVARFLAAIIMLQTLYFKFSGSPESVYIFNMVGMEPAGRWGVGVLELIASILLVIPKSAWMGAMLGIGLMIGAIGMHLTLLGIEVMDDGGYLFFLAILVFLCTAFVGFQNKGKILGLLGKK